MDISKTWVIIKIGTREYAINSSYVKAVTELKHTDYIAEGSGQFSRGMYDIFHSDMPVIDGYRLTRETPKNSTKLEFSSQMTKIKLDYMAWLNCLDSAILSKDSESESELRRLEEKLADFASTPSDYGDVYIDNLGTKLKENIILRLSRGGRIKEGRPINEALKEAEEIRRASERYVLEAIDNLIYAYTSKLSEMCIVLEVKGTAFGITIDSVEMIVDVDDKVINKKNTVLSTAIISIKGKEYNVLDLTKLKNIL